MLNQCPTCGGGLIYDIPSALLKCNYCEQTYDPATFQDKTKAEEQKGVAGFTVDTFVCPACGAEIASTDKDAVNYCLYCGSFVSLDRNLKTIRRPDTIIPFSKTIEDCKQNYSRSLRDKLYGRSEFKKAEFLDGFKPIFIPYWRFDYTIGPEIKTEKVTTKVKGQYEYGERNYYHFQARGTFIGAESDASSTFDDAIGYAIEPFSREAEKPFNPSYMFGFYGDTADVNSDVYEKEASEAMSEYATDEILKQKEIRKAHVSLSSKNLTDWTGFHIKESLVMLPVWFLTWRKGDRVAYSVMNGDTGKMHTEIPISMIRYLLISLITAVPIFFLLNANFTYMCRQLLQFAMLLSGATLILHMSQMERIIERTLHFNDEGYLATHKKAREAKKEYSGNFLVAVLDFIKDMIFMSKTSALIVMIILCAVGEALLEQDNVGQYITIFLSLIVPALAIKHAARCSKHLPGSRVWIDVIGSIVASIASGIILFQDPAADMAYYIAAIICLVGVAYTAIMTMRRYNDLITRPVPHFFDREKGGTV